MKAILIMKTGGLERPWAKILADIAPGDPKSDWRWTAGNPHLQFKLAEAESKAGTWNFVMEFFTNSTVLDSTGPQTVTVLLDHEERYRLTIREPKSFTIQFPVPAGVITPGKPVDVQMRIGPLWKQSDGAKLGVLLHYVGFTRDLPS